MILRFEVQFGEEFEQFFELSIFQARFQKKTGVEHVFLWNNMRLALRVGVKSEFFHFCTRACVRLSMSVKQSGVSLFWLAAAKSSQKGAKAAKVCLKFVRKRERDSSPAKEQWRIPKGVNSVK